jgi:membrane protein YdbS with pleckstrin-like domain
MKNFFNLKTTWTNVEFIPLKLCIASAYILIGIYFVDFFKEYWQFVALIFIITVIVSVTMWIKKMQQNN